MKKILVVSGHPDLGRSIANKTILEELRQRLPEAETVFLDQLYPDFRIDADAERERLLRADGIVLQFPLYWYGVPALMKKWMEDVFVHGFAHGSAGQRLQGKKLIVSFTSGAPEEMYCRGGKQNYPIEDFLPPLRQFAGLCGMEWKGFVFSGGFGSCVDDALEQKRRAREHAAKLVSLLRSL